MTKALELPLLDRECGGCRTIFRGRDACCPICNPFSSSEIVSAACALCGNRAEEPCLHDDAVHFGWTAARPSLCLHAREFENHDRSQEAVV